MDYNQAINKDKLSNNAKTAQNSNSNCWVVFADSQVAAKSLAVTIGYTSAPQGISSGYGHYHDGKHRIRILYGKKILR